MTLAQIGFVDCRSSFRPVSWTLAHDYFVEKCVKFFIILLIKQPNRRRVRKFRSGVKPANRRAAWRKPMAPRLIASGVCAAIAGAAMVVAVSSSPSFAFTLSSPSVTDQVIKADVHQIYYYRRHYYYHHYYHRYYRPHYHHYYHPYYHPLLPSLLPSLLLSPLLLSSLLLSPLLPSILPPLLLSSLLLS